MGDFYKTALFDKDVLDTLRAYVDVNDEFLQQLYDEGLLEEAELDKLQKLVWPMNRNQLLQLLIKKKWDGDQFAMFCNILSTTQTESQQLNALLEKSAREVKNRVKIKKPDSALNLSASSGVVVDNLDHRFAGGLNPQIKSYIMREIGQRDAQIRSLTTETDELRKHILALEHDNEDQTRRLHDIEEYIFHVIAGFDFEDIHNTIEEGIDAMCSRIAEQEQTIASVRKEKQRHLDHEREQSKSNRALKDELLKLTNINKSLESQLAEITQKYAEETNHLQQKLEAKVTKLIETEKRLHSTEHWHMQTSTSTEQELNQALETINRNKRTITDLTKERDKYREQTEQLEIKCKRLLNSLNLNNNCDEMTLSLDHARNMTYVRKRKSLQEQPKAYLSRRDSRREFKMNTVGVNQDNNSDASSMKSLPLSENKSVNRISQSNDSDYFSGSTSTNATNPLKPLKKAKTGSTTSLNSSLSGASETNSSVSTNGSNGGTPRAGSISTGNAIGTPRHSLTNGSAAFVALTKENGRITEEDELPSCVICGRSYDENANFEGACVFHKAGAVKLHEGTGMEVWSCCKSVNTIKGCQKARHTPVVVQG